MEDFIRVLTFCGTVSAAAGALYFFILSLSDHKMKKENQKLDGYIKDKSFFVMKNDGESPCDTDKDFTMPEFSQECDYLLRRDHR